MGVTEDWLRLRRMLATPEETVWLTEQLLRIRTKSGKLQPLRANRAQRLFEERRGPENIVLKARQMGLSTWIAGRFLLRTLLVPGSTTLMVAHTRESAEALFATVTRMWENLPTDVRRTVGHRDRANAGHMTFPVVDSEFRVASAGEPNAGRGLTVHNLHLSEVARWQGDAAETLAGLRASLAPGGELVMESTANGAYGCFYNGWQGAKANGVVRHFFPWWLEPAYVGAPADAMTAEEAALALQEELTAEQIGFRRELQRRFGALRSQEFAEDAVTCFRTSGSCFFDRDAVQARLDVAPPAMTPRRELRVWLPPVPGRAYIAAEDAAGGGSDGDFAAVQVIDRKTGMQCAELQDRLAPRDLARRAAELACEYNGALLVVERNNHGAAVLAFLDSLHAELGPLHLYADAHGTAGWLTDVGSRPKMLSGLAVLLSRQPELFMSDRLLEECRSFVTDEHGRAAAARGSHDDLVMAIAIAEAVRAALPG